MSTGDPFYYVGATGIYSLNAQQATSTETSTNNTTYCNPGLSAGILGASVYGAYNQANQYQQFISSSTLSDMLGKAAKPVKEIKRRAKGILANLRSEIDGWHGDILERCPA